MKHPTRVQQFKKAPKMDRKYVSAEVVRTRARDMIEIDDRGLRLTVNDARALRDWLSKVLP